MKNLLNTIFLVLLVITAMLFGSIGYKLYLREQPVAGALPGIEVQKQVIDLKSAESARIYQFTAGEDKDVYTYLKGEILEIDADNRRIRIYDPENKDINKYIDIYTTENTELVTYKEVELSEAESNDHNEDINKIKRVQSIHLSFKDFQIGDLIEATRLTKENDRYIAGYVTK